MENIDKKFIQLITDSKEKKAIELLDKVHNINCSNKKLQSALQLACNRNMKELVSKLLEKKAVVDSRDQWHVTPLMRAAYQGNSKIVKMLLQNEADINAKHIYGKSAIMFAADNGNKKTVELLLDQGANIDDEDDTKATCLHYSATREKENTSVVELILDRCSNKFQKDDNGKNALDYAIEFNAQSVVRLLKEAGLKKTSASELKDSENEKYKSLVKNSSCSSCGGKKETPTEGAWIYCDYCAACIDWDFNKAIAIWQDESLAEKYLENYEERNNRILSAAKNNDIPTWRKLTKLDCELEIDAYPALHPSRVKNRFYREQYIEYLVQFKELLLRKDIVAKQNKQNKLNQEILWNGTVADHVTFMKLLDYYIHFQKFVVNMALEDGILQKHPDQISAEVITKINLSAFVQAWLPYLEEDDRKKTLDKCNLSSNYHELKQFSFTKRKCGACGADLKAIKNSTKMVCGACGVIIDTEMSEVSCSGCGTNLSFPSGESSINCPSCNLLVTKV